MSLLTGAETIGSWKGAQGSVEILRLRTTVAYIRMVGIADQPAGKIIERALEDIFTRTDKLHTFWDLRDLVNYHSDVRVCSTNALLAQKGKKLSAVHTLSTSKIVAMGVSVANLALGGIVQNHKSAVSFEAAVRAVL
ncbi:MAG TPA: hypothetical protein VJR89_03455 [Polyangiales bacterium]|nr:hypothetical protein [Polyangiales bacterium]